MILYSVLWNTDLLIIESARSAAKIFSKTISRAKMRYYNLYPQVYTFSIFGWHLTMPRVASGHAPQLPSLNIILNAS